MNITYKIEKNKAWLRLDPAKVKFLSEVTKHVWRFEKWICEKKNRNKKKLQIRKHRRWFEDKVKSRTNLGNFWLVFLWAIFQWKFDFRRWLFLHGTTYNSQNVEKWSVLDVAFWILVLRQKHESKIALNSESLPLKPQGMQEGSWAVL